MYHDAVVYHELSRYANYPLLTAAGGIWLRLFVTHTERNMRAEIGHLLPGGLRPSVLFVKYNGCVPGDLCVCLYDK